VGGDSGGADRTATVRAPVCTDQGAIQRSGARRALLCAKVGDRFQNIAIISVIPNMVKAGYRG
jgi:hypothetical protein